MSIVEERRMCGGGVDPLWSLDHFQLKKEHICILLLLGSGGCVCIYVVLCLCLNS
jgi:hypothetical protein